MRASVLIIVASLATALTGCSSLLYYPAKHQFTDPKKFKHHPEDVHFTAEDGTKLHGWYFKSPKRPAKAAIVLFHGNAQNLTTHFFSLYWAIDRGFDFLIFDYRGYGQSEGEPTPHGTLKDGKAALRWMNAKKDPGIPTIIFGQSLGGAIALRAACESKEQFDKIVVDSTFSSYRSIARKVLTRSWLTWPFQWVGWLVMNDTYAPKNCIEEIAPKPLLVVHGTNDRIVEYEFGERVYELARDPKEFWRIEGGGHTDFLFRETFRHQDRLVEWILKTSTSAAASP